MRKVVFVGNCQANVYRNFYADKIAPLVGDEVSFVATFFPADDRARAILGSADVVVAQLFDLAPKLDAEEFSNGQQVIRFPSVSGSFLWPFCGQPHPRNRSNAFLPHGPYDLNMGDRWLNRFVRDRDLSPQEAAPIADEYVSMDLATIAKAERYYELTMGQMKERDTKTGFACADIVERNLHNTQLFYNPSGPSLPVSSHLIAELFLRLGAPRRLIEDALSGVVRSLFGVYERPIHPSIVKLFDLRYIPPGRRYRFWCAEMITLRDYAFRYLQCDWNEPLMQAEQDAGRLGRDAPPEEVDRAIERLHKEMARSAGSASCELALSRLYERRGEHARALGSYAMARMLDPDDGFAVGHFGHVLSENGRTEEAIQQMTEAVARWPQIPDHRRRLTSLLHREGRHIEALATIEAAVISHPNNKHIRDQHIWMQGEMKAAERAEQQRPEARAAHPE